MKMLKTACLALAMTALAGPALAEQEDHEALRGYTRTGETETCLIAHRIRDVRILNDHQILFRMYGGGAYLQEPASCPTLRRDQALQYRVSGSQLCSMDIITLLDTGSSLMFDGTCGFSEFQELERVADTN